MIDKNAFCYNHKRVKAIVLGADPGNFSDHGNSVEIKVAFAIGSGDARYFNSILKNLSSIGLSITDVYVQNLITTNPGFETSTNPDWEKLADQQILERISEFNQLDPKNKIPVLVTAERILKYLAIQKLPIAETLYSNSIYHPIPPTLNKLKRRIYPFFRNPKYSLNNDSWIPYRKMLAEIFV